MVHVSNSFVLNSSQSLAKEYVEACQTLKGKLGAEVECHAVNSRVYHDVAEEWGITGYPWVAFFYQGKKVEDMAGLGGADSIVNWVSRMHAEHFDPSAVPVPASKVEKVQEAKDEPPTVWASHVSSLVFPLLHTIATRSTGSPASASTLISSLADLYPSASGRSAFLKVSGSEDA